MHRAPNQPLRVAFLYNHEAAHQVRHSAVVIPKLLERYSNLEITVLGTSDVLLDVVRDVCGGAMDRIEMIRLSRPGWRRALSPLLDKFSPFSRLDHLYSNRTIFARFDAVIVTEGTSLFLKKLRGLERLKVIRIDHGAGDRSIGFTPSFAGNDLVLIAGAKQRERFRKLGYLRDEQMAVVGYTKFDAVDVAGSRAARRLFPNDKPVVLYNPHPDASLSSWYKMGLDVLDFFHASNDYNLIFAPHVMLFKRRIHVSLETWAACLRRDLPARFLNCPHILVDTGSDASIDMTYTLAADIYLGDVSSQVYEFLIKRRPCIFLNAHDARWQNNDNYAFWQFGPVLDDVGQLDQTLSGLEAGYAAYRPVQEAAFRETFDLQPTASSVRAADAIARFLKAQARNGVH